MKNGDLNEKAIYPFNDWEIIEDKFELENNYRNETIFAAGNGYLGMRGNFEEGLNGPQGTGLEGTYINGFFESEIISYGEIAYGYAEKSETMLNIINGKIIKLFINHEEFNLLSGKIMDYKRVLNLKTGVLSRYIRWESPTGKQVEINIERIISFGDKNIAVINYEVVPLNFKGTVKLLSEINGNVTNQVTGDDPRVGSGLKGRVLSVEKKKVVGNFGVLIEKTQNTKFSVACAMENAVNSDCTYQAENISDEFSLGVIYSFNAKQGEKITLTKYLAYTTSRDNEEETLGQTITDMIETAKLKSYETYKKEQAEFLSNFWYKSDIEIKGDAALHQGIRFNMFHLLQSVGRDGKTNIAAKGLTGEGYEGHYFWDTEIYMLPFFLYNNPEISRKLLEYRYNILDNARKRARIMSHKKGALYPWRTINGDECSAYFPAGTAQYHIDADIAFAVKRYMDATGDTEFLLNYGAEILFETARLWSDLGNFIERKDNKFCIHSVTGPDEYSAIVNNNFYTNIMAKENLQYASETADYIRQNYPEDFARIKTAIKLEDEETTFWRKAAENMYLPYDEKLDIIAQDDDFLDKPVWDFKNTPKENYPLLMHYHPLVIYRHQVLKQADVVLAMFLLSHKFTPEQKKRNYDYYESITTHDSSLSHCTYSVVASEIGYHDIAYEYFMNTARMDLDDYHGNVKDGIHAANMAGAWMCVIYGFGGMRAHDGQLSFNPNLPSSWKEYSFRVNYRGRIVKVTVNEAGTTCELLQGEPIDIHLNNAPIKLK